MSYQSSIPKKGWKVRKSGEGSMKWTKWESLLSRQFSKVHLQVYKDISARFSVGVRARSKVACLCYTDNPCTPCHPVHCNELQMDNQHPYPPSTPTSWQQRIPKPRRTASPRAALVLVTYTEESTCPGHSHRGRPSVQRLISLGFNVSSSNPSIP